MLFSAAYKTALTMRYVMKIRSQDCRKAAFLIGSVLLLAVVASISPKAILASGNETDGARPNVLWLVLEDTSPWMGCYGDPINADATPHIDGLAQRGVRFSRAYVSAPVCSPCRSALVVGANQIRFGAHEHRSSISQAPISLPDGWKPAPQILNDEGYFTFNLGKTDYNFEFDKDATYNVMQGRGYDFIEVIGQRGNGQPFFGQIQMAGGKGKGDTFPEERKVRPEDVTVPPDYPDNEITRAVVAEHYNTIRKNDDEVGAILQRLDEEGLLENTVVFYFSDHGAPHMLRHKQMPTEGGLHVPLIVDGPERLVPSGIVRDDLTSSLDIIATTFALAGVSAPNYFEGRDLFADDVGSPEFVASARDRCDGTIDRIRSLRTDRFRYTRNLKTDRVLLQPQYRDGRDYTNNMRELYANGELESHLVDIYFGERKAEELFDLDADPHQLVNLADDPTYEEELLRHRQLMDGWLAQGDMGEGEESDASMDHWGNNSAFVRQAVNPEYEVVREDTDGDGLSDQWELNNDRDPNDGRLLFTFDCGGWQTEGWEGVRGVDHLPGRQGYLDFHLTELEGEILRMGLSRLESDESGEIVVWARSSYETSINMGAGGYLAETKKFIQPGDQFTLIAFPVRASDEEPLSRMSLSKINGLNFVFHAPIGTRVEIDKIEFVPDNE
jgi:N-sulfoglucosamine sulfohydrolase